MVPLKVFWTLCVYKNYLRGVDTETLNAKTVFESNGLYNAYTFDFQNEPSSPLVSSHKRFGRSTESNIIASNDLGSFDGGYEVVNESLFDCLNLLWLAVYKTLYQHLLNDLFYSNECVTVRSYYTYLASLSITAFKRTVAS